MANISETLKNATEILRESGVAEPRREANSLLAFTLGKNKTFLIAHNEYELSIAEDENFQAVLRRRAAREPLQYITGRQEFYGLDFAVSPDVLIPRPETELIVENAVEIFQSLEEPRFCEVGVGSGCISVAILHNFRKASAIGLDISERALAAARKNAERHDVAERFDLRISDVFGALEKDKFDLIVSNPPYIPHGEMANLQAEVRDFEPTRALTDGADGLSIIEKIIRQSPAFLKPEGFLLMEIGFGQSGKVGEMFDDGVWQSVEFVPDLQGIARIVRGQVI